jgi:hypothetical protein
MGVAGCGMRTEAIRVAHWVGWPGSQKKGAQKNTTRNARLADDCGCSSKRVTPGFIKASPTLDSFTALLDDHRIDYDFLAIERSSNVEVVSLGG